MLLITVEKGYSQDSKKGKKSTVITLNSMDTLSVDSTHVENAPLDIAQNRGLFIVTPDQKMQLRILGSIRYLIVVDNMNLADKNSFQTYEIPTGSANDKLPNYYNGLNQTRLGFEVTRKTVNGNLFARLEMDFAGVNGFRIRQAYGQYGRFLLGQTWSLFSQISALPATVNFSGPIGAVSVRTPQIRYTFPKPIIGFNMAAGLEYVIPDLQIPDSLFVQAFQLIPTLSYRMDKKYSWGYIQLSGIFPVLSARNEQNDLIFKVGWGLAGSAIINSWANGKWFLSLAGGKAITPFINNLSGYGLDVFVSPSGEAVTPLSVGSFITYDHTWRHNLYSNLTYGMVTLEKVSFEPGNQYHLGYAIELNTFWEIVEGANLGGELIWGKRVDKSTAHGDAVRFNLLFYYDF